MMSLDSQLWIRMRYNKNRQRLTPVKSIMDDFGEQENNSSKKESFQETLKKYIDKNIEESA